MVFYPFSGITPHKELWDKIKNEITRQLTDTVTMKDSFVDRLLDILLKDFGQKETKRFTEFLKRS